MATPAAERWSEVIDEQEASGLTIREFARQRDLKASTLSWWRSRLGRARRRAESAFVEVVTEPAETHGLTLTLTGMGVDVKVDLSTDMTLLRRVVDALC